MTKTTIITVLVISIAAPLAAQTPYETIHGDILRKMDVSRARHLFREDRLFAPQPTPVQLQLDVLHYEVDIAFNPSTNSIGGNVKAVVMSLADSLYSIDFDADAVLTISSVSEVGAGTLAWSRPTGLVSITLSTGLAQGEQIEIEITYTGDPTLAEHPGLFFRSYSGAPVIYSLSEPWGARAWWPCKDYPEDKATFSIYLSVPSDLFAASNGNYIGYTDETCWGAPYKRFHWEESYPMAPYLFSIAASEYVRLDDYFVYAPQETMPITHYVYPSLQTAAEEDLNVTVPMLQFLSSIYGLYPYTDEKYGVALCSIGGGMEHQTLTSYGSVMIRGDHYYDWIFVHEMGHQWFGDLITCKDWTHIWLNEGFASYTEALWFEHLGGPASLKSYMEGKDRPAYWHGPILRDPDNDDPWYYFDNVVYGKAAWVLHMFRHIVGDTTFFQILQSYVADSRFRHAAAETDDFVGICVDHYGASLDWFFDPWLSREDRLQYEWSWNSYSLPDCINLTISIDQLQYDPYTMPVDFRITTEAGQLDTTLWIADHHEEYRIALNDSVLYVEFDPDHWILCDKTEVAAGAREIPVAAFLEQNYPNPFNPATNIRFGLPNSAFVRLQIFDVRGTLVKNLVSRRFSAGVHEIAWDGTNSRGERVASGLYFYRLKSGSCILSKKMILLR